jgi:hypothetical protein
LRTAAEAMTTKNLPVACVEILEEEALAFARAEFARVRDGNTPWSESSELTKEAGRAAWRHVLTCAARYHPISRMEVITRARLGDPDARDVLRTLIIEARSGGGQLPRELEGYEMELLAGGPLPLLSGPKRKDKILRDLRIALTVAAVCDRYGLRPTRNPESRGRPSARRSACSIVAEVLAAETPLKLKEVAVEAIWARLRNAMPTVPGWARAES